MHISSGRLTVVDLNDTKQLQLFISSSQPKTQIFNTDSNTFTPDWALNKPVLTPQLFVAGTSTDIINNAKSINWYEGNDSFVITNNGNYTIGAGNKTLTIKRNILGGYIDFDGVDDAIALSSAILFTGEFRIDARVSIDDPSGTHMWLGGKDGTQIKFGVLGNNFFVRVTGTTNDNTIPLTNHGIVAGKEYNISLVRNADNTVDIIANGVTSRAFTGSAQVGESSLQYIGRTPDGTTQNQSGIIKNVGVTVGGTLTHFWGIDEGYGNTVYDSVGTINGTISGSPTWLNTKGKLLSCEVVYNDPDTGFDAIARASIELTKFETGSKGVKGDSAISSLLTNEYAVVSTDVNGDGGSFGTNTSTTLKIFSGATDVTSNYTISQARTNVTVTEATTSATASVTALSADTGSVVFTATRSGYPTLTKTFTIVKSRVGSKGADANSPTSYWINTDVNSIIKSDSGVYTPSTINVNAYSQTGTTAPSSYSGRFIIAESSDGTTFTDKYTSSANENTKSYSPSANIKSIRIRFYQAGGTSTLVDEQVVPIINDGANSVRVVAWAPNGDVIANSNNNITAQADIYNGGIATVGTNYRWYRENPSGIPSAIAGNGWEDLDAGKDNVIPSADFSAGWGGQTRLENGYDGEKGITIERAGYVGSNRAFMNTYFSIGLLEVGTKYTMSGWYKINSNIPMDSTNSSIFLRLYKADNVTLVDVMSQNVAITGKSYDTWYYFSISGTIPSGYDGRAQVACALGVNGSITVSRWKLERGDKSTPFNLSFSEQKVDPSDTNMYGRNLLKNTRNFTNTNGWSTGSGFVLGTSSGYLTVTETATENSGTHLWARPTTLLDKNKNYTLTVRVKSSVANVVGINWADSNGGAFGGSLTVMNFTVANTWYTFTGFGKPDWTDASIAFSSTSTVANQVLTFEWIKLEEGSMSTDWIPAPEDNSTSYPNLTSGINKWIYQKFDDTGANVPPTYDTFKAKTSGVQTLIADGTDLVKGTGSTLNYIGYLRTAVYSSTAKTLNLTFQHDDSCAVYLNTKEAYSYSSWTNNISRPLTLNLEAGWNSVEFLFKQATGGDGVYSISSAISTLVDEMNCDYALNYGALRGLYNTSGYNTPTMTIPPSAVLDVTSFKCLVGYRSLTYMDTIVATDATDPIVVKIIGSNIFRNGQGSNIYNAKLIQAGAEIDVDGAEYTYRWYIYKSDGTKDASFGGIGYKTGKSITITSAEVNKNGRLICEIDS